jgi:hypothetical protein
MKNSDKTSINANLRKKAEVLLKKEPLKKPELPSEADTLKLIHELKVHQIELEMQNEELMLAKEQAVIALDRYIELYDFAPSAYITVSVSGKIDKITLAGANLLGKERSHLFYSYFYTFVTEDTLPIFNSFFARTFNSKKKESCQIDLTTDNNPRMHVYIEGIAAENSKECYLTVLDISELKK